jgi:hypothetical protein
VCDGDPDSFEKQIYECYLNSFVRGETRWRGYKIVINQDPRDAQGRDWSYRHLTTVGEDPKRKFDLPRAERLPWIKPILEASAPEVVTWAQRRRRTVVALPDFTYVVILDRLSRGDAALLVTAYPVQRPQKRQEYQDEYGQAGELALVGTGESR